MFDAVTKATESEKLPFPYNKSTFCRYEPIEKKIEHAKVLIVNDLLRYDSDISDLARKDWNGTAKAKLEFERKVSGMACNNIAKNVLRLVQNPKTPRPCCLNKPAATSRWVLRAASLPGIASYVRHS